MCISRRMFPALVVGMRLIGAALTSVVVLLSLLLWTSAAFAGPTVKVRVEGESSTLLPLTAVTLEKPEPVSGCPADSANAAINLAVKGNWDHGDEEGSKGDFTQTILGETHTFTNDSDTWAVWINDKWGGGICEDLLSEGDEVLMIADHEPAPSFAPTVLPLVLAGAPADAVAGMPFAVSVSKVHTRPGTFPAVGEGTPEPEAGVTISGGGASAESNARGIATLTLTQPGTYTLTARKSGDASSAPSTVCVRESSGGGCGAQASTGLSGSVGSPLLVSGAASTSARYTGPYAVVAKATGLIDGHVYKRGHAPRILTGSVLAHTTVSSTSLELRREYKGRCYAYDGVLTRFVGARCGHGSFFKVSNNGLFSYLLPSALASGRYVLDLEATDAAGNHTTLARGTSRIVFYVR
jgi:hypothetical protein